MMVICAQIRLSLLCGILLCACAASEYILEDLIAMEDNNRRVIHNIGDEHKVEDTTAASKYGQLSRPVRQRNPDNDPGGGGSDSSASSEEGGGGSAADSSTKSSKETTNDDDEERKTLAQQVADGKYGLIQAEIFADTPSRPGIISYEVNPEVPKDNVNNLGGLKPEEIWLAENHLLVLGGGGFSDKIRGEGKNGAVWPPIDNYMAPERQVKIPPNPKVPPPFPIQLRPGGPTEFIRGVNGTGGPPPYPPFPGFFPPPGGNFSALGPPPFFPPRDFNSGNFTPGNGVPPGNPFGGLPPPFPYFLPPGNIRSNTTGPGPQSFIPPQFPGLPPGANFLPPPGNLTEPFDEDDPSIYYPPPYDFVYRRENTSVPAGPLVPGIVLPPPPDFFAPLEDEKKTKKPGSKSRRPSSSKSARPQQAGPRKPNKYNERRPPTVVSVTTLPPRTTKRPSVQIVTDDDAEINEVTPETLQHIIPPNAVVQGWVPIPAPRPFYITGPRKPLPKIKENTTPTPIVIVKNHLLRRPAPSSQFYNTDDGYIYEKPRGNPSSGWIITNITQPVLGGIPSNEVYAGGSGAPLYVTTTVPPPSIVPYHSTAVPQKAKALKTFYFYEEPQDLSTTALPPSGGAQQYYSTPSPSYYYPQEEQRNRYVPSPIKSITSTPSPPAGYYYITQAPAIGPGPVSSTRKPPIYEYSYTAPGYGTVEAPKVGTTIAPPYPSYRQPSNKIPPDGYAYYDDYVEQPSSTPRTPTKARYHDQPPPPPPPRHHNYNINPNVVYTTARPIYKPLPSQSDRPLKPSNLHDDYRYTTPRPTFSSTLSPYIHHHQRTENPYHAYFTHHDVGLIDDITKKYFTIFGQKLNNNGDLSVTTPLAPAAYDDRLVVTDKPPHVHGKVKFPTERPPAPLYYTSPVPPAAHQRPSAPLTSYYDYDYYDSAPKGDHQRLNSAVYSNQQLRPTSEPPPSLLHDTDVNYKGPVRPIEPDAEIIDPAKFGSLISDPLRQRAAELQRQRTPLGSSLISYSLPGNGGGHFYFLTPQTIQDIENSQSAGVGGYSSYDRQPQSDGDLYYYKKRNTRRQPSSVTSSQDRSPLSSTKNSDRRRQDRQYTSETSSRRV